MVDPKGISKQMNGPSNSAAPVEVLVIDDGEEKNQVGCCGHFDKYHIDLPEFIGQGRICASEETRGPGKSS
jgi:hypothetical protein